MPYIEQSARDSLEPLVEQLFSRIKCPGDFAYVVCRLWYLLTHYGPGSDLGRVPTYHERSRWRAAINDANDEIYVRGFIDYEETKQAQHGDVFTPYPQDKRTPFSKRGEK